MSTFDVMAKIRFAADNGSLAAARRQTESALSGLKTKIAVEVDPRSLAKALSNLQAMPAAAQAAGNAAKQAAGGYATLGAVAAIAARNLQAANQAAQQLVTVTQQAATATRQLAAAQANVRATLPPAPSGRTTFSAASTYFGVQSGLSTAVGGIREGARHAAEFQRAMTSLRQVSEDSDRAVGGLGARVGELARGTGSSSEALVRMAVDIKAAGFSASETDKSLSALSKARLGPSFGDDKTAVNGLIAAMRQFKLSGEDSGRILGSMASLSNAYAVEAQDLATAVSKAGGAFASAGGNLDEFLGLMTALRSATRESAATLGTSARSIVGRLQRPEIANQLRQTGIELTYSPAEAASRGDRGLAGQFVGPMEAIRRVGAGLGGMRTTDPRYASTVEAIGGAYQASRLQALLRELPTAERATMVSRSGESVLNLNAEQALGTPLNNLSRAREEWLALAREAGDGRAVKELTGNLLTLSKAGTEAARALSPLLSAVSSLPALGAIGLGVVANRYGGGLTGQVTGRGLAGAAPAALAAGLAFAPSFLGRAGEPGVSPELGALGSALATGGGVGAGLLLAGLNPLTAAAVGAAAGLVQFRQALEESKATIRASAIDAEVAQLSGRLTELGKGGAPLAAPDAIRNVERIRAEIAGGTTDAGKKTLLGFEYGYNNAAAGAYRRREELLRFGPQLMPTTAALAQQAEQLGRRRPTASLGDLEREFKDQFGGLLQVIAAAKGQTTETAAADFKPLLRAAQTAAKLADAQDTATRSASRLSVALSTMTDVAQRVERSFSVLDAQTASVGVGSAPAPGAIDFREAGLLAAPFGEAGRPLTEAREAIDFLRAKLPGLLAGLTQSGDDEAPPTERIRAAFGVQTGERGRALDVALGSLASKSAADVARSARLDPKGLADELVSAYASPAEAASQQLAQLTNSYRSRIASLANRTAEGDGIGAAPGIATAELARREVLRERPTAGERQAPFQEEQRALAGPLGGNPQQIGRRLAELGREIPLAAAARDRAPANEFKDASLKLSALTSEANHLREALRGLADTSRSAAGLQQRLNEVMADRDSKLSWVERGITGEADERLRMRRGYSSAVEAGRAGSLAGLSRTRQREALGALGALGQATIPELGGKSAAEVRRELLTKAGGDFTKAVSGEEDKLRSQIAEAFETEKKARLELANTEKTQQEWFFGQLDKAHKTFLSELSAGLKESRVGGAELRLGEAQRGLSELRQQGAGADLLRAAGITTDEQVKALAARRSELVKLAASLKADAGLTETRAKLAERLRSGGAKFREEDADYSFWGPNRRGETGNLQTGTMTRAREYLDTLGDTLTPDQREKALSTFQSEGYKSARIAYDSAGGGDKGQGAVYRSLRSSLQSAIYQTLGSEQSALKVGQAAIGRSLAPTGVNVRGLEGAIGTGGGSAFLGALDKFGESGSSLTSFAGKVKVAEDEVGKLTAELARLRSTAEGSSAPERSEPYLMYRARGGSVFSPRGTDTVPAMLSPGEFIVTADAAQQNKGALRAMNAGAVYREAGGFVGPYQYGFFRETPTPSPEQKAEAIRQAQREADGQAILDAQDTIQREEAGRALLGRATRQLRRAALWNPGSIAHLEAMRQAGASPQGMLNAFSRRRSALNLQERFAPNPALRSVLDQTRQTEASQFRDDFAPTIRDGLVEQFRRRAEWMGRTWQATNEHNRRMRANAYGGYRDVLDSSGVWSTVPRGPTAYSGLRGFAFGGLVGGTGVGDRVPALLSPGEFVLNRGGVQAAGGVNSLLNANASGGGKGEGGLGQASSALSQALKDFNQRLPTLTSALTNFSAAVDRFAEATKGIPDHLEVEGTQTLKADVNVTVNGGGGEGEKETIEQIARRVALEAIEEQLNKRNVPQRRSGGGF